MVKKACLPLNPQRFGLIRFPYTHDYRKGFSLWHRQQGMQVIWHKQEKFQPPATTSMVVCGRLQKLGTHSGLA